MDIRKHLMSRGLDPAKNNVIIDDERGIATFLLWDLSGRLTGYQQYNPSGTKQIRNDIKHRDQLKYFTFAGNENNNSKLGKKKLIAWGFESFHFGENIVFITEGIFDAVKLHNAGLPALAVISNDPKHLRPLFRALGRTIIAVCDRDEAGDKLAKYADLSFRIPEPYHDLGDMPQEKVEMWLKNIL